MLLCRITANNTSEAILWLPLLCVSHLAAGQKTTRRGLLSARKYANRESSVVQRRINRKKAKKNKKSSKKPKKPKKSEKPKKSKKQRNQKKKKTKKTILQDSGPIHMYLTEFLNIGFFCFFDFLGFFVFFGFVELFLVFRAFFVFLAFLG